MIGKRYPSIDSTLVLLYQKNRIFQCFLTGKPRFSEKVYYLYHSEIPNKNDTLCWIVSQITESVFELLKHQPCNNEEIVFEKEIGQISGDEPERRGRIYIVLALATGRTIGYYRADDGTYKICLGRIPETVVPNDNHS